VTTGAGLRERKKQLTRQRIADTAIALFAERGFDHVRVAEIARVAEVSEATVFNYFPTKEDLVYGGMVVFERTLLDAIRSRPPGTSALQAFRTFMQPRGALTSSDPATIDRIATIARIVRGSRALQAREQQLHLEATDDLAEVLSVGARAGDLRPYVLANAIIGVNRAMTGLVHEQALAGRSGRTIARKVIEEGGKALDLLEQGCPDV
jgi:AcrR family transcriptional regulator